jgi:hypothetical protein
MEDAAQVVCSILNSRSLNDQLTPFPSRPEDEAGVNAMPVIPFRVR